MIKAENDWRDERPQVTMRLQLPLFLGLVVVVVDAAAALLLNPYANVQRLCESQSTTSSEVQNFKCSV